MILFKWLHFFISFSTLSGLVFTYFKPDNLLSITAEELSRSSFSTYLIPILFVAVFMVVGNFITGWMIGKQKKSFGYLGFISGLSLLGWIVFHCYLIQAVYLVHILFFILGSFQSIIALWLAKVLKPVPFNSKSLA